MAETAAEPLETAIDVDGVNFRFAVSPPEEILRWAAGTFAPDVILTCSFQHDGVALAHMLRGLAPWVPVLFVNTGFHFPETLSYMDEITKRFDLNLKVLRPSMPREEFARKHGLDLYSRDPDLCCAINKVAPLRDALDGVRCWINGRRRNQSALRRAVSIVERYEGGIHKVNPLVNWTSQDTHRYLQEHGIPEHPLFEKGYASIGCAPCTRPIIAGEDERAGRWSGTGKSECGIHTLLKPA
ncbi:MAG: phosphoadenylyl-sulfate reductase [Candidatus Binatia bacterium]